MRGALFVPEFVPPGEATYNRQLPFSDTLGVKMAGLVAENLARGINLIDTPATPLQIAENALKLEAMPPDSTGYRSHAGAYAWALDQAARQHGDELRFRTLYGYAGHALRVTVAILRGGGKRSSSSPSGSRLNPESR